MIYPTALSTQSRFSGLPAKRQTLFRPVHVERNLVDAV